MALILCVDDDEHLRMMVSNLLTADGFTVLTAEDGVAAMELSRQYPGSIDLLLSDMEMPRMGGLELCRKLKLARPGIQVLLMSGGFPEREHVSMIGWPLLQKPFTCAKLRHSIEALIGPTCL